MVKHLLKLTCWLFVVIIKIYLTQFFGKMAKRSWEKSHLVYHFFSSQGQAGPGWVPSLLPLAQPEQKGCAKLSQLIAWTGCSLGSDGAAWSTGEWMAFPAASSIPCCLSGAEVLPGLWVKSKAAGGRGTTCVASGKGVFWEAFCCGWITGQHISSPGGFPMYFPILLLVGWSTGVRRVGKKSFEWVLDNTHQKLHWGLLLNF